MRFLPFEHVFTVFYLIINVFQLRLEDDGDEKGDKLQN